MNARVFLISDERCSAPDIYGSILDSSMLCAGILQGGIDSCQVCMFVKLKNANPRALLPSRLVVFKFKQTICFRGKGDDNMFRKHLAESFH